MIDSEQPRDSIEKTDQLLANLAKRGSRAITVLVCVLLVITLALGVGVGVLIKNNQGETKRIHTAVTQAIAQQQSREGKLCDFFGLIGQLPVMSTTVKAGVAFIVDSRNAYVGLECQPRLTLPSSELLDLAAKYNIQIEG